MNLYPRNDKYKTSSRCGLKKPSGINLSNIRIYTLVVFILLIAISIIGRLYFLQVKSYAVYEALAANQHSVWSHLVPKRGEVYLKDQEGIYPVAVNKETKMAYAVPHEVENPADTAKKVAEVLGLDLGDTITRLSKPEDMYEVLKHKLSDEEEQKINDLKLSGIHLADESYRYYPAGELASHILGFVGWRDNEFGGRYGLELYFDDKLRGENGSIFQSKDASGRWVSTGVKDIQEAKDGDNLVLTVDHIIQYETEKILKAAVEKNEADRGSIIVMEPSTGRILAMANYPTFDPNNYGQVQDMETFRNLAVSDAYESGSVFKTFTMAAAIDNGKINPDTTYTDTGVVKEAGYDIRNSDLKANGVQTMTQVLEKSLNTGVIFAEKLVGNKNFADYMRRFGFGDPTGIDMYGESKGNINNLKNLKSDIQFFTASFGQGITVTPIQLAAAYSAIANQGVLMKPEIVEKVMHSDGSEEEIAPQEVRRVISPESASKVSDMLRAVVVNGHGKRADVPGYLVGGKTGTAQVASSDSKGYAEGKNIGSFAGFAPLNNPKYTIVVRVDNPRGVDWAESSAAPAFGELMKFLLEYDRIEPTEKYTQKDLDDFNKFHDLSNYINQKDKEGENTDQNKEEDKNK